MEADKIVCEICHSLYPEENMLLCDNCNVGCHTTCVDLEDVPAGSWYCENCLASINQKLDSFDYIDPT